jgi:hypothetical protein
VNHPDDFAEEIRATLRSIRTTSMNELLLELALVDEAVSRLSVRCYKFEGDEFLAATAYSDSMGAIDTAATSTESESVRTLIGIF